MIRRKTVNSIIALNLKISLQNFGNVFLYGNTVDGFTYSDVLVSMKDMFLHPRQFAVMNGKVMLKFTLLNPNLDFSDFPALIETIKKYRDIERERV